VSERAQALADETDRPANAEGIALTPLQRGVHENGLTYEHVDVAIDGAARTVTLTVKAPAADEVVELDAILARGAAWWPLAVARELDDAVLHLRTNVREAGIWIVKTSGEIPAMLRLDEALAKHAGNWFVRETRGFLRRALARLEVSSRSIYAVVEKGSCFAGTLLELALASDRTYMLLAEDGPAVALSTMSFGPYTGVNGLSRLASRFGVGAPALEELRARIGELLGSEEALRLGLVTFTPDELDWDDELRVAIEERASLSPDALSGMEASLRFAGNETLFTKIFGRLSAWQNWIFVRPNAVGDEGALKLFGGGTKPRFNWERV
jgi:benzoyl-CoA-dihydrodiol lyase